MRLAVADLMTTFVVTAEEGTPFRELVRMLEAHRISALPVVDDRGRVVGVVSQVDLLRKEPGSGTSARVARELMTAPAFTVAPGADIRDAARLLHDRGIRRLVVVDGEGRPMGVISRSDVVQVFLRKDADLEAEVVDAIRAALSAGGTGDLAVSVRDGVVTISGRLPRRADAKLPERLDRLASEVPGVVAVHNQVTAAGRDLPGGHRRRGHPQRAPGAERGPARSRPARDLGP